MIEQNETHLDCTLSDTDLFTPSFVQSDIQHGYYEEAFPISKLNDNGPIEFILENASDKFIDLANSRLKVKLQIQKGNGNALEEDEVTVPINYIIGTLISQVDIKLGGTMISASNNTYAYRAYLETLLNYGSDAKKSQLQMGLYQKEPSSAIEIIDPTQNVVIADRLNLFKQSRIVEVCGKIHSDIFHQGRLIPNGVSLKVTLHRNKPEFTLLTATPNPEFKLTIVEAILVVRKVQLTAHKFMEIQKTMEKIPALFPINRVEVRTHSVAAGLTTLVWDNAFQGHLPNKVFIGMIDNDSFTGTYKKNPFNFKHYSLRKIGCYVNGESQPSQPIKLNFEKNLYLDGYHSLFTTTGKLYRDEGLDINRNDYKNGYSLFGFDLSPAVCSGGHQEPVKRGTLRLEFEFQKALPNTITIILYADFDSTLSIDKFRQVLKNY